MAEKSDNPEKATSAILPPKRNNRPEVASTSSVGKDNSNERPEQAEADSKTLLSLTDADQPGNDDKQSQETIEGMKDNSKPDDQAKLEGATASSTKQSQEAMKENSKPEGATASSTTDKIQTMDRKVLVDQIKGVLYGNCIGDAIGLLTEFMEKAEAQKFYGSYEKLKYDQKVVDGHRRNWKVGDWTDDSDQMILILRTLVDNDGEFNEKDFAKKLKHWVYHGYQELGDKGGCGLGRTTASVLSHKCFLNDPHKAAKEVWEGSGRYIAPNGGVMRTSILGTLEFDDLHKVIENTKNACKVTHADPRCIASCVAVTVAIALMLQRKYVLNNGEQDVEQIMSIAHSHAQGEIEDAQHKNELTDHMFAKELDKLELDSPRAIGYTFKCMGAGFWAFRQKDFRKAIQEITMEAGDADTNCAVAGALLGCKVGFNKLPKSWVTGLCNRGWLDNEIKRYFALLKLQR